MQSAHTRRLLMALGFLAAFCGDWFLAIKASPAASGGFACGVLAFCAAQLFWSWAHLREARLDAGSLVVLGLPLSVFAAVRLFPAVPPLTGFLLVVYAMLSVVSFAAARGTRRVWASIGIGLLLFSDLMIAQRILKARECGFLVGPTYVLALVALGCSLFARDERRWTVPGADARFALLGWGGGAMLCFSLAMLAWPGADYNPFLRMLSALGRSEIRGVRYPLCHFLFMGGLACASLAVARAGTAMAECLVSRRRTVFAWGVRVHLAGLLAIALLPENVSMFAHNAGCWMAALGGGAMLWSWRREGAERYWLCGGVGLAVILASALLCHAIHLIPFAPAVPTAQKALILFWSAWIVTHAWRGPHWDGWRMALASVPFALALLALVAVVQRLLPSNGELTLGDESSCRSTTPLCADERAALAFLDHVTGPLPAREEADWWRVGGTQHGYSARRYHLAFIGYAAAALGQRGSAEERRLVGRILGHCMERYLSPDVWGYSQSRSYWGRKPWAPDPCFRENVMYTGHLLQLLAYYELFTGDRRYHADEKGFDFVWKDGRRVHYSVERLIKVTVEQMRTNPGGGISCEPGLVFFPCNNHPHVALKIFSKLGYGDWSSLARRWEGWATRHFRSPLFGGGLLNLVYHPRTGIFFPRGSAGLDAWSLLWYEAWASNPARPRELWRQAANRLDWTVFDSPTDGAPGEISCCNPAPVPTAVEAAFLAAAARACGDPATARRLETALDAAFLDRSDGFYRLNLHREWRLGASAMRILALALEHGSTIR